MLSGCLVFIPSYSNFIRYDCSLIEHVFCAHLIIFLRVLNLDIITSAPPLECLHCLCYLYFNRFYSFIFKLYIIIVHTLKMCTGDAGPKQSLVLVSADFKKNSFRNTIRVSNSLNPDKAWQNVGSDLFVCLV